MSNQSNRRVLTIAAALGLALGTSMLALAAPASLPDEASDQAHEAVAQAEQRKDAGAKDHQNGEGGNAEAFSAWVQSIPEDWGCVRGKLVSSMARQDHRGSDFEGPTYGSLEEAAADLGMEDRKCVEAAANGESDASGESEDARVPEDAPSRVPEDVPSGTPEDVPSVASEDVPSSPPDDVDSGSPEDVPPSPPDQAQEGQGAPQGE
jgi:hypothetical protein